MNLEGQIAIITGAARGIGFSTARRLASIGATVNILDINGEAGDTAAAAIIESGGHAKAWTVDVTDESQVNRTIGAIYAEFEAVQILVNNAGIYPHIPFEELTFEQWKDVLSVNLESTFLCSRAVFPYMKKARYGRIVSLASAVFFNGYPGLTAYAASKGGVIGFSRVLASECGEFGITANVVSPGLIESEGVLEDIESLFDIVIEDQSIKRRGQTTDIAECIAYLVSPQAGFITGQTINIDGGSRFN